MIAGSQPRDVSLSLLPAGVLVGLYLPLLLMFMLSENGEASLTRYSIYALPVALLAVVVAGGRVSLDSRMAGALAIYVVAAAMSIGVSARWSFTTTRDLLILISLLGMFVPMFRVDGRTVTFLGYGLVLVLVVSIVLQGGSALRFDFFRSQGFFESVAAFPIALAALYCLMTRRYGVAVALLVATVFGFKRIAIAAIFVGYGTYILLRLAGGRDAYGRLNVAQTIILLVVVSSIGGLAIFLPEVTVFMLRYFEIPGMSMEEALLGRASIILFLRNEIIDANPIIMLFGHGVGQADLDIRKVTELGNPHNDFLKVFYDYGAVGGLLVFVAMWLAFARNALGAAILVFNAFLMVSDNVFIYFYHQFVALLLMREIVTRTDLWRVKDVLEAPTVAAARAG